MPQPYVYLQWTYDVWQIMSRFLHPFNRYLWHYYLQWTYDVITSIPHITLDWYIQKGISDYSPSLFSTPLWCYNITNPSYYFGLWYIQKGISDYSPSLFSTPLNHIALKHMVMGSIPGHWLRENICWERSTP